MDLPSIPRPLRGPAPIAALGAAFVLAGGYVHLREWLETYRDVPSGTPGAFVVTLGFPVNAALSAVLAIAIAASIIRFRRALLPVLVLSLGFQLGALALVILTRTGSVFGWAEPTWTAGANDARATAIGAIASIVAAVAVGLRSRQRLPA